MKYLCTNCNYVYDNALWDIEENIEVWMELEKCPVCEEYDIFQWIEEEINYICEENWLWALEVDHFPEIEIKDDKLIFIWKNTRYSIKL